MFTCVRQPVSCRKSAHMFKKKGQYCACDSLEYKVLGFFLFLFRYAITNTLINTCFCISVSTIFVYMFDVLLKGKLIMLSII